MMKVKDLAEICGVSEQAIRQFYSKNNFTKRNGKWQPTEQEIESLLSHYHVDLSQPDESNLRKLSKADESTSESALEAVSILKDQLDALQEQLRVKDKQIEDLQTTINDQQSTISKQQDTISGLIETNKALAATTALNTAADKKELLLEAPSEQIEQPQRRTFKDWWHDLWNG